MNNEDRVSKEEVKRRFIEEVKLRAYDDKYIDRQEEKEILKAAIDKGLTLAEARSALTRICEQSDYIIESVLDQKGKELLEQFAANDGQIDEKEFKDTVAILTKGAKGRLSADLCRKKVKEIILAKGWQVREGFMKGGNWFSRI